MWVSKKRFEVLEKRIADLEGLVKSQHKEKFTPEDSDGIQMKSNKKMNNPFQN